MEDTLSSSPDEIITQILVHLNTKEVLRTRILSKRWNPVWEFVPVFKLCDDDFIIKEENLDNSEQNIKTRLSKFLDRVLVACKSHRLEKISITTNQCVNGNIMISWMRAAIEKRVSELVFNFLRQEGDDTPSELTPAVFASDYLTVLILRAFTTINIPTTASSFLPNLKFLDLCFVVFRDDLSLPNLLSSCPNLQDLLISQPRLVNTGTLYITSRSLKTLLVEFESTLEKPENELKTISIDTPALESIDISCGTVKKLAVKELPCLVEAKLNLYGVPTTFLNMFLTRISHVKFLTLKPEATLSLVLAGCGTLPLFGNLTRLNFYGTIYEYDSTHKNHTEWAVMLKILKCSPMLETLILQNYSGTFGEYGPMEYRAVPHCLTSRLKNLEIEFNISNCEYDGEMLAYFLAKAKVLKTLTVRSRSFPTSVIFICSFLSPEIRNSVIWSDNQFTVTLPECSSVEPLKWEVSLTPMGKLRKCRTP